MIDVIVVGGGPSGLSAASALRRLGVRGVTVLDREPDAGGIPRHCFHTGFGLLDTRRISDGPAYARRRVQIALASGVEIRTRTTVLSIADRTIEVTSPRGIETINARAIVVATGCRERPRAAHLVAGSRPAGVLTTGSLQQLVHLEGARVGERAVIVGAEHVSYSAAHTLSSHGAEIVAMVTELQRHQTLAPVAWGFEGGLGIPLRTSSRIVEIRGRRRVESVVVRDETSGREESIYCDTVVFTGGWIPDHELARRAGIELDPGTLGPRVDLGFRSSQRGVFAVGNVLHGAEMADHAALEGEAAAVAIARYLTDQRWPERRVEIEVRSPLTYVAPSWIAVGTEDVPSRPLVLRSERFVASASLVARQDGVELCRKHLFSVVPNRSIHLSAGPLARAALGAPIELSLE